jgi:hypothetical protein
MIQTSVLGFFCEDIREEKSRNRYTIVGTFGQNINVRKSRIPAENEDAIAVMPRLCLYLRANFDPTAPINPIPWRLIFPDGTEEQREFGEALIKRSQANANKRGYPVAGVQARLEMSPFPIPPDDSKILVEATVDGKTYICAMLAFNTAKESAGDPDDTKDDD